MSAIDCFPLYHFRGDALTRGLNYGESLANRIRETFNFYNNRLFKRSRFSVNEFKTRAEHVRTMLGAFDAELVTELDAVARGAELPRWQIYLLNARTEILNAGVSECTALAVPEARLLGQTWDWFEGFDELAILVKYSPDSGPSIFTFTEPGMLAKIGFNERGLGICLNFLDCSHQLNGVPVHLLIRAILNQPDVQHAHDLIKGAGFGKSSHFLVADRGGGAMSLEFTGDALHEVMRSPNAYVHTNHCIYPGAPAPDDPTSSSAIRIARAQELIEDQKLCSVKDIQSVLTDTINDDCAIDSKFHESVNFPGERIGTCGTFIMDLARGEILIKKGPGSDNTFHAFSIENA